MAEDNDIIQQHHLVAFYCKVSDAEVRSRARKLGVIFSVLPMSMLEIICERTSMFKNLPKHRCHVLAVSCAMEYLPKTNQVVLKRPLHCFYKPQLVTNLCEFG